MKRCYYTYFDRNYLVKGIALIESIQRHEKSDYRFFVICADELTRIIINNIKYENVITIPLHDVESDDNELIKAKQNRSLTEYYWSLKAAIALYILNHASEVDTLTYLDADLFFCFSPETIFEEFGDHSILIHEHRFSSEQGFLEKYGKYNAGFLSFRNDAQGVEVLKWWRDRCLEWCHARLEDGKFGDQLYLNEWPIRFKRVKVLQNIGAGVGPWNHIRYGFSHGSPDSRVLVNDTPLIFYHFHSLSFISPQVIIPSKHLTNPLTKDILRLCFVPYLNTLSHLIDKVRAISPDFDFGVTHGTVIDYRHTFLARREMRPQIENSAISQFRIPFDKDWDCYCSEQLVEFSSRINHINGLLKGGETTTVLSAVMDAMKEFPDAPPLLAFRAELEHEGKERIYALERLLKSYPNCARAESSLGLLYHNRGNKDKAVYHYERAVKLEPQNIVSRKILADFYYVASGRTEEALELYLKIFTVNPFDVENLLMLGHICVYLKRFEDAEVFYDKVLEIEPWNMDAKEKVDQLTERRRSTDSPVERSEAVRSGRGAEPEIGGLRLGFRGYKADAVDREERGAPVEPAAKIYQNAQALIRDGRDGEGISILKILLKTYPEYAAAHNDLGVLLYGRGNKEEALCHYEKAVQFEPGNDTFQKNLADFYYVEAGRMEEALRIYVALLDSNPTDIEILHILGRICASLGKRDDAGVFFNRVLELEPWNMDAREKLDELMGEQRLEVGGRRASGAHAESAEKMYQDAQGLIKNGRNNDGIGALERLLEAYPDFGLAHNDLGVLYFNQGEKDKALAHYERAARIEPRNDTFRKNLADFYYVEAGRMEEALRIYVALLDSNPTDIETLLILGQICASLGKRDDAGVFFNRVLELEPWNADAREKRDQLEAAQDREEDRRHPGGKESPDGDEIRPRERMGTDLESMHGLPAPVVGKGPQPDSDKCILSLVLSSENSERVIGGTGEEMDATGISKQIEIVVGDKASKRNGRGVIEEIQHRSKNIIYIKTGEGYPRDAVDALRFVAEKINEGRTAADIKREFSELSSSTNFPVSAPDMADRFILLFECLSGALKELSEPFRAPSITPEQPVSGETSKIETDRDIRNGDSKKNILNRIVTMKNEKGLGWKDIAEIFNSEGLPTFSGKGRWHRKTVYKMYQKTLQSLERDGTC